MRNLDEQTLTRIATRMRKSVVAMIGVGKAGHLGGAFSLSEIVAYLYFHRLRLVSDRPKSVHRDRFILSKGHGVLIQYAALAELGLIREDEFPRTKALGSILQGHPDMKTPGIEAVTGSLGQGLSIGLGMALGLRIDHSDGNVHVVIGDGELAEGQLWEAAMATVRHRVSNLIAILDRNGIQATSTTKEIFEICSIREKWEAFGWNVLEIDGHNFEEIDSAFAEADEKKKEKPVIIIANTIKRKGLSFAENVPAFHNGILTQELYDKALIELDVIEREVG